MSTPFQIPEWLIAQSDPPLPPVDDHRVEGLVNGFIAGKQDALFGAPDAYYRNQGRDALDGAPAIARRLQDLRSTTLEQARDDGERAALAPRLDAHLDDAMDGIGRHVEAQRLVFQRNTLGTRQALIQRAAQLEHDNDDKITGLAEAHAGAAQELARLDGVEPESSEAAAIGAAARSQILRTAIDQRIANARPQQAIDFHDKVKAALTPDDRRALELPIGAATDDAATDAWLARESIKDGAPLSERAGLDDGLSDTQRLILRAKIDAHDSAAESSRVATVKGLDDQLAAATKAIAAQPSQYRIGTLNALAKAYEDAGAPEQANDTRRLASQESILRLFAQAGVAAQQRHLNELSGPERTMAEAIMRHQADAFAKDPYAAGTALYPDVGPALPEDDTEGRLRQTRMIEAMREAPSSSDATVPATSTQPTTAPANSSELPERDRVWTDGQLLPQAADQNLVLVADSPEPTSSPTSDEPQGDVELAQGSSKANPSARPAAHTPASPQPGSKPGGPTTSAPSKPLSRQEQAAANKREIDRLAGKPASDYPSEKSFPEDWQKRLPQATLDAITREANAFKVPPELLARIMWKESKFEEQAGVKEKNSGQGIAGITDIAMRQLIQNRLEAAQRDPNNGPKWGGLEMAVRHWLGNMRLQAEPAIGMEAEYLRHLYDTTGHSWPAAVASYKHGPTIINAFLKGERTATSIPRWGEVQAYLGKVFDGDATRFDAYK